VKIIIGQRKTVGEPHTVNIVSSFALPNSIQFAAMPSNSNNESLRVPGQNNVVIAVNARSFAPTVIDSPGDVMHFAVKVGYTMNGSENYVTSGWLLPKGQEQGFPEPSTSFTITFQKAGIYSYICQLHPWMVGTVAIK